MAGDGPLADGLTGADRLGWLSPDDLRRQMAGVRMVLFPSFWQEPFGMVGIESLAESTPLVAAVTGGMGDWADRGCLQVPPGDVPAMAAAINRLAGEPEFAELLGRDGRAMVVERFGRTETEARLQGLYDDIAGPTFVARVRSSS